MAHIHIIVGSVMGTATQIAQQSADFLNQRHTITVSKTFDSSDFSPKRALLICTSNTGVGDLPANIVPFYHYITCNLPNIAGQRYGIINLGDSSYPNFAKAGETLDNALADIGAIRAHSPLVFDALEGEPSSQKLIDWLTAWETQL